METNLKDTITELGFDGTQMYGIVKELYPICRSITGNGVRETLNILKKIIPLEVHEVPTGTKAYDWTIPEEWNIKDAYILDSAGNKIIDFNQLNLHVLNYSIPIDEEVSLEELKAHVYTIPDYPDWVPYRTSYHNRQWGFCMSQNQLDSLKEGKYRVKIDSAIQPGSLSYGEYFIQGKTKEEVLITCHTCHPSLCNDNLSGITIAAHLAKYLSSQQLKYSYRFLFIPGTIGSITWLSRNEDKLPRIRHGMVLTLLGDSTNFRYKQTRKSNAEIDQVFDFVLHKYYPESIILPFTPYGYDERQFCSPGIDLPVGRISRKPHGEFPEYHTSQDNLNFVATEKLEESIDLLLRVIEVIEKNNTYLNLSPKCEPQLGKRGLFQTVGGKNPKDFHMALLWVLNQSDGENSLLDIAQKSNLDIEVLAHAANELRKADLLREIN